MLSSARSRPVSRDARRPSCLYPLRSINAVRARCLAADGATVSGSRRARAWRRRWSKISRVPRTAAACGLIARCDGGILALELASVPMPIGAGVPVTPPSSPNPPSTGRGGEAVHPGAVDEGALGGGDVLALAGPRLLRRGLQGAAVGEGERARAGRRSGSWRRDGRSPPRPTGRRRGRRCPARRPARSS